MVTGDPIYEEIARSALHVLLNRKSHLELFGNHTDIETNRWTVQDDGNVSVVDYYFEYLVKCFENQILWKCFILQKIL